VRVWRRRGGGTSLPLAPSHGRNGFDVLPLKKICFKIANEGQIERANFDAMERDAMMSKRSPVMV